MKTYGYFSKILNDYVKQEIKDIMKKEIFKVGDSVYCALFGWGIVSKIDEHKIYPVCVDFKNKLNVCYTFDGRYYENSKRTLSFSEYILENFSQERPIELPKIGEDILVYDENNNEWILRQFLKYDEGSSYPFHCSDRNSFCVKSWSKLKRIKIL
jgi:hypothetical protein